MFIKWLFDDNTYKPTGICSCECTCGCKPAGEQGGQNAAASSVAASGSQNSPTTG